MRSSHTLSFLMVLLFLPLLLQAQDNSSKLHLNYGLKVGFHAATYNTTIFEIDGYEYDDRIIQSNKIGYSVSPFIRLSKNRYYIQTEATMSISRHNFEFNETTNKNDEPLEGAGKPQYNLTTYCMQVPLLVGYKFVDSGPYGMSFFTGPKAKFVFTGHDKQRFKHFRYTNLEESLRDVVCYWELGFGVKISNICFDFVYDIGLNNSTNGIISKKSGEKFYSKRSDNLLSFSLGIIF